MLTLKQCERQEIGGRAASQCSTCETTRHLRPRSTPDHIVYMQSARIQWILIMKALGPFHVLSAIEMGTVITAKVILVMIIKDIFGRVGISMSVRLQTSCM